MRHILIDTDTASDDAIAILMALRCPEIEVVGITTLAGNCLLPYATRNAIISCEIAGTYMPPVYAGCDRPLVRDQVTAVSCHGEDGLSDQGFSIKSGAKPEEMHAADAIAMFAEKYDNLELITLGPLTNVAMAIRMYPEAMKKVKKITAMGGQYLQLNPQEPVSEFNMLVDPDAVDIVLKSGIWVDFVPLDCCFGDAEYLEKDINDLYSVGTDAAHFCIDCNRTLVEYMDNKYGFPSMVLADPTAVAYFIHPEIATEVRPAYIQCEIKSPMTKGELIYDFYGVLGKPNNGALVCSIDGLKFKKMLADCCAGKEF